MMNSVQHQRAMRAAIICLALLQVHFSAGSAELPEVKSPDGTVRLKLAGERGVLSFEILVDNVPVIERSSFGIQVDGKELTSDATVTTADQHRRSETYPWRGIHSRATNHYNGLTIDLTSGGGRPFTLEFRAFNDGIAFRHLVPGEGSSVPDESTTFVLPQGSTVWHHGLGGHYEDAYEKTAVSNLKPGEWIAPPMTFKLARGDVYASITEAALVNYSGMAFQAKGDRQLQIGLGHKHPISYPFRLRYSNQIDQVTQPYIVHGTIRSPWRVILVGRDLNTLVNSDVVHNLCPPPDKKLFLEGMNTAWIKPGRAVWKYLDGGANSFENMKDFSRWAGELGFEYHVIEGFWSRWSDEQIRELVSFSKENGVGLWFWRHSRELRTADAQEAFFKKLETNGVVGAKIDFFDHEQGEIINLYAQLLRKAAEHRILVNFHGANKPTGEARTWPNELIREGVRGMESSRFKERASHDTTLPFTRYLAGPADYTPVHFGSRRADTTPAHQIATAAVFNEPLLTYGAHPTNLLHHPALPMIKSIPPVWDETEVLPPSAIGEIVVFARRVGTSWFLAALNGPEPRTVNIPLSFLDSARYKTLEVADDPMNRDAVKMSEKSATKGDVIRLDLAGGGGYIARFSK